jgi:hypothetical protein
MNTFEFVHCTVQKLKGIFIEMNGPDTKTKPAKVLCKTQNKIKGKQ